MTPKARSLRRGTSGKRGPAGRTARPKRLSEEQATAVNAAIRQLDLPWRDLFDAIEAGTPAEIGLLSLEPDSCRAVIRIEAEADSSDAMLNYVETLKRQPFLTSVFLMKHAVDEKAGNHPLRFEIEAAWRSDPP
jgi:Tfp pilus assembly protein PilN